MRQTGRHDQGRWASQVDPAFPRECRTAAQCLASGQLEEHVAPSPRACKVIVPEALPVDLPAGPAGPPGLPAPALVAGAPGRVSVLWRLCSGRSL